MRQSELIVAGFVLLVLGACTKEKRENPISTATSGPATLSSLQNDVFHLSCATSGCHDNRATPAGNLDLSTYGASYAGLVNKVSRQVTSMKIVDPGFPDESYLVNKLQGTHITVGGTGSRMPQYAAALTSADLDRILTWITDGAQQN